jgi:hypothetical protein
MLQALRFELDDLNRDVTEQEIKVVIMQMPSEKALGPDGYIGAFYKLCWDTVTEDVIGRFRTCSPY